MDKERYHRHFLLPGVGEEGQCKLKQARVLVVGAGGLGSPVLQYLVAAGIGRIGIVDADVVSLSNLQRQILYKENDVGLLKVYCAEKALKALNSTCCIDVYPVFLNSINAADMIRPYDVVVGSTDSYSSRQLLDKHTRLQSKPFVHGSISEFEGQVSVFNFEGGPAYSALFPNVPEDDDKPLGVMGVLPGIIGSIQAFEVLKIVLRIGDVLSGKLLVYNALKSESKVIAFF